MFVVIVWLGGCVHLFVWLFLCVCCFVGWVVVDGYLFVCLFGWLVGCMSQYIVIFFK